MPCFSKILSVVPETRQEIVDLAVGRRIRPQFKDLRCLDNRRRARLGLKHETSLGTPEEVACAEEACG